MALIRWLWHKNIAALLLSGLLTNAATLMAQDLEPRTYTNLPVGQNFVAVGYAHSEGEINPSPSVPLKDLELELNGVVTAYVRSLDLWGKAGKVSAQWGRLCMKGDGEFRDQYVSGDRCGTIDPSVGISYLFYGAPAMSLAEFRKVQIGRVIGVSIKVDMPVGDYNNENLINTGSNRWTFKPEVGISNRWGNWSMENAFAVRLFSENDNFFGGTRLEQDPLYQIQTHLIYQLPKGRWMSLNGNYFWGGRTEKNGIKGDDVQENSRVGVTLAWPLTAQHSLKFYANSGLVTSIGNDSDTFGILWQYRWGDK